MSAADDTATGTAAFATVGATLLLVVPLYIAQGWALSLLWAWFLVPLGVPAIGIAHAIGIALLAWVARATPSQKSEGSGWEALARTVIAVLLKPLLAVAIGWIVRGFIV